MRLPAPRGPLSSGVIDHLRDDRPFQPHEIDAAAATAAAVEDPLRDEDLHLALALCYELHYRGFDDVGEEWEWDLGLLAFRAQLEQSFESELRKTVPRPTTVQVPIDQALRELIETSTGSGVSQHLMKRGTVEHYRDFLVQRSVYHLKEADPHSWVIPRLDGRTKAALMEIQTDEYGGGDPARMHAALFARTLRSLGLDDTYGAYWDEASGATFATVNLMSMFGLHRRLRGAILGHLAAFEMDSTVPNRRYGAGLRRLGYGVETTEYFDEHVEADAVHEQVAAFDMCGSFVDAEPALAPDVLWGAACGIHLDSLAADHLLTRWGIADAVDASA